MFLWSVLLMLPTSLILNAQGDCYLKCPASECSDFRVFKFRDISIHILRYIRMGLTYVSYIPYAHRRKAIWYNIFMLQYFDCNEARCVEFSTWVLRLVPKGLDFVAFVDFWIRDAELVLAFFYIYLGLPVALQVGHPALLHSQVLTAPTQAQDSVIWRGPSSPLPIRLLRSPVSCLCWGSRSHLYTAGGQSAVGATYPVNPRSLLCKKQQLLTESGYHVILHGNCPVLWSLISPNVKTSVSGVFYEADKVLSGS